MTPVWWAFGGICHANHALYNKFISLYWKNSPTLAYKTNKSKFVKSVQIWSNGPKHDVALAIRSLTLGLVAYQMLRPSRNMFSTVNMLHGGLISESNFRPTCFNVNGCTVGRDTRCFLFSQSDQSGQPRSTIVTWNKIFWTNLAE